MKFLLPFILIFGFVPGSATAQETGTRNDKNTQPKKNPVTVEELHEEVKGGKLIEPAPSELKEETTGRVRLNYGSGSGDKKYNTRPINEVASMIYQFNPKTGENNYGVLKNGKELLPMIFNVDSREDADSMVCILGLGIRFGVFDIETERWIIPIHYNGISAFNSSTYIVRKGQFYGVVDTSNNLIIPTEWNRLEKISDVDNCALAYKSPNYGILNVIDKKLTVPCVYSEIVPIENSTFFKVKMNDAYNIVDINNKPRFKNWYQELYLPSNKQKNYIVKLNNQFGIIDEYEKTVLPIEYQESTLEKYTDGSYLFKNKNGKYGCVTMDGQVSLPFEYDHLKNIHVNFLLSKKGNKRGLIQVNKGNPYEILPCDFDGITPYNKIFLLKKNQKFGLLDRFGKIIAPVEFDKIDIGDNEYNEYTIRMEVFIVTKGNLQFLMNDKGEALNDSRYDQILSLYNSARRDFDPRYKRSNYFVYYKDNKAGILDISGEEITASIFDDIFFINPANNLIVKQGNKVGYYSLDDKKMVVEPKYDQISETFGKIYAQLGNTFYLLTMDNNGKVTETKL